MYPACKIIQKTLREEDLWVAQKKARQKMSPCLQVLQQLLALQHFLLAAQRKWRPDLWLLSLFHILYRSLFSPHTQANKASVNTSWKAITFNVTFFCCNKEHGKFPCHNTTRHSLMMCLKSMSVRRAPCMWCLLRPFIIDLFWGPSHYLPIKVWSYATSSV